jgi:RNA polymerase sigma-70 factor (ECF subfamily)
MLLVEDRALLEGFRAGKPEALRRVYDHYLARVHGQLRAGFSFSSDGRMMRFCGYREEFDVDNATQEVFARAFAPRARLAYDGLRPYGDYLMAIARNYVLNELRRTQALFVDETEASAVPAPAMEEQIEERELDRLLAAFTSALDEREREYYEVRFTQARTQVDAAERLGVTRIVARRIEAKIKTALLDHLKTNGYLSSVPSAIAGALLAGKA